MPETAPLKPVDYYHAEFEEAMLASNEAGCSLISPAETIRCLSAEIVALRERERTAEIVALRKKNSLMIEELATLYSQIHELRTALQSPPQRERTAEIVERVKRALWNSPDDDGRGLYLRLSETEIENAAQSVMAALADADPASPQESE